MDTIFRALTDIFSQELGPQLKAIYRLDGLLQGVADVGQITSHVLIVTEPGTDIHHIRQFFQPFWAEYGEGLGHVPLIAPEPVVRRHLALFPLFAQQVRQAQPIMGSIELMPDAIAMPPVERIAVLAAEVMRATVCLTPELLDGATAVATPSHLHNLAHFILERDIPEETTAVTLLIQLHRYLQHQLDDIGYPRWEPLIPPDNPLLPNLEAAYKFLGHIIMAFEYIDADWLTAVDWQEVTQSLTGQCTGLQLTTSTLLQLTTTYETPLAITLRNLQHDWGANPLNDIEIAPNAILRHAARKPSLIYLDTLTHTFLTEPESEDHTIIHDFQNKILNIQLEHELLHRLQQIPRFTPPEPLPERSTPSPQRIDAIYQHLDWWSNFYAEQISGQ